MKLHPHYIAKALICLLVCGLMSGCANGPVRYKTLGYKKYATVELTKRAHPALKVLAAPAGVVTDALVIAVDTPAVIVWSVPLTLTSGGPESSGYIKSIKEEPWFAIPLFPIWFPLSYSAELGGVGWMFPLNTYQDIFGVETGVFRERPPKCEESNCQPNPAPEPAPDAPSGSREASDHT